MSTASITLPSSPSSPVARSEKNETERVLKPLPNPFRFSAPKRSSLCLQAQRSEQEAPIQERMPALLNKIIACPFFSEEELFKAKEWKKYFNFSCLEDLHNPETREDVSDLFANLYFDIIVPARDRDDRIQTIFEESKQIIQRLLPKGVTLEGYLEEVMKFRDELSSLNDTTDKINEYKQSSTEIVRHITQGALLEIKNFFEKQKANLIKCAEERQKMVQEADKILESSNPS